MCHEELIAGMADRVVHMTNGHVSSTTHNAERRNPRNLR